MKGRYIKFDNSHRHIYVYSNKQWVFVGCRIGWDMSICTAKRISLPRGFKFDGITKLRQEEEIEGKD